MAQTESGMSGEEAKVDPLTRLHEFCAHGTLDMVQELLTADISLINQAGAAGNACLHLAAQGKQYWRTRVT